VVIDDGMLHPELSADVSGAARAHSLRVDDVDLDEAAGCPLLSPGLVLSWLCSARFHQSPCFISLGDSYCDTIDITYNNYNSDNRQ